MFNRQTLFQNLVYKNEGDYSESSPGIFKKLISVTINHEAESITLEIQFNDIRSNKFYSEKFLLNDPLDISIALSCIRGVQCFDTHKFSSDTRKFIADYKKYVGEDIKSPIARLISLYSKPEKNLHPTIVDLFEKFTLYNSLKIENSSDNTYTKKAAL